jgi:flagellar hook assembly protein FlgD
MKAWDLLGNVSKDTILIEVPTKKNSNIRNLMVLPNPIQTNAKFSFELKNSIDPITVQLEVFDANGIRNFSTSQKIQPSGNKIMIDWDGLSNNGGLLLPGKYYYRITVNQNGLVEQLINSLLKF